MVPISGVSTEKTQKSGVFSLFDGFLNTL